MWAKARDPVRREKTSASKRGKKRTRHVFEAMQAVSTDRWTPREDELVRSLPTMEAAKKLKRSLVAVLVADFDSDHRAKRWVRKPRLRVAAEWRAARISRYRSVA